MVNFIVQNQYIQKHGGYRDLVIVKISVFHYAYWSCVGFAFLLESPVLKFFGFVNPWQFHGFILFLLLVMISLLCPFASLLNQEMAFQIFIVFADITD